VSAETSETGPAPRWNATTRWALVVVLAFAGIHGRHVATKFEPNSWLFADGSFYFTTLRAITGHGRLEQKSLQPASWYEQDLGWNRNLTDDWSNVALGREGRWYPKHPILVPLAGLPFFALFGTVGTLLANVSMNLAFVLLCFLLARRVAPLPVAAIATVLTLSMPFVQDMSYSFSNDVLGTVLLLAALESTLAGKFGFAGICAGFALWSRLTNAAFVPSLLVVSWSVGGMAAVVRSALFACGPLGAYAALNTWMFGVPWTTPYQNVLVRENGVMTTASHARLFTVPFVKGVTRLVTGGDGAFRTFWPAIPGLLGTAALAFAPSNERRTRRALAAAVWCATVFGIAAFAKYAWYRPHFLYPIFGLATVGVAALLALPVTRRRPVSLEAPRVPRLAWAALGLVLVVSGVVVRSASKRDGALLSTRIDSAKVFLGDVPCDYWNPQNERWECAHHDRGGWSMQGRMLGAAVTVKGAERRGLWLHPSATGWWRRLDFGKTGARSLTLDAALGDASKPGPVDVEAWVGGERRIAWTLDGPGDSKTLEIPLDPEAALELRVRSGKAEWKHLAIPAPFETLRRAFVPPSPDSDDVPGASMPSLRAIRASLVDVARRYSRVPDEIEDLAHDLIVSALRREQALSSDAFLRASHGSARRHAAFLARSAARRRVRDATALDDTALDDTTDATDTLDHDESSDGAPITILTPALQTTLLLLVAGLEKAELRLVLGVSDAALRKRFQALREHGPLARPARPRRAATPPHPRLRATQIAVLGHLCDDTRVGTPRRALAIADPDGHGLIFTEPLTIAARTATTGASATSERTPSKGSPC